MGCFVNFRFDDIVDRATKIDGNNCYLTPAMNLGKMMGRSLKGVIDGGRRSLRGLHHPVIDGMCHLTTYEASLERIGLRQECMSRFGHTGELLDGLIRKKE